MEHDGTFKNIDLTLASDASTTEFSSAATKIYAIRSNGVGVPSYLGVLEQEATPNAATFRYYLWYKPSENVSYESNGSTWSAVKVCPLGLSVTNASGVVTSLTTFTDGYTDRVLTSRYEQRIRTLGYPSSVILEAPNGVAVVDPDNNKIELIAMKE